MKKLNIFEGKNSVLDFLNPDNTSPTPMVEIPDHLNPYKVKGVRIFAKLMNTLPLSNIKSLPAYNMLLSKKENGKLSKINTIIENSSGNTVFSLAIIARLMGIKKTKAISSNQVSLGKLNILRFLGTEIIINEEPICPDPADKTSGIYKAKKMGKKNNWFNPGQYENEHNPEAHYKWTGPQIWRQTSGKISIVSVGLGTTGTATGIGKYLKEKDKNIKIIGISRSANNPIPGVRTNALLRQVAFDWKAQIDHKEEIGTVDSFKKSLDLCRAGLFVGPSSGFALAGLLKYLSRQDFRDNQEKIAVFICPDGPFPYINEYFEYLDESHFPKIKNEHLLINKPQKIKKEISTKGNSINIDSFYKLIYKKETSILWQKVLNNEKILIPKKYILIDVREKDEFQHFSIPGSINIPLNQINKNLKKFKDKKIIFICKTGNRSSIATEIALQKNIKALNLEGGTTEWSRLNLPRVRPKICVK